MERVRLAAGGEVTGETPPCEAPGGRATRIGERLVMRESVVPQLEGDEFLLWEARQAERFELHHGFVVAFAGGTAAHSLIASNALLALRRAFPAPCRVFNSGVKIEVSRSTYYYPDVSVVCREVSDAMTASASPRAIVEVLSERTRAYDLIDKRAAYRTVPSLEAYVLIDAEHRRVELDRRIAGTWQTSVVSSDSAIGQTVVTVDELYDGTSL